jgi:hypothetical protein
MFVKEVMAVTDHEKDEILSCLPNASHHLH